MKSSTRYYRFKVLFVCFLVPALTCAMRAVERSITLRGTVLELYVDGLPQSVGAPYTLTCTYDSAYWDTTQTAFEIFEFPSSLSHTLTIAEFTVSLPAVGFSTLTGSSSPEDSIECLYQGLDGGVFSWDVYAPSGIIFAPGGTNILNEGIISGAGAFFAFDYTDKTGSSVHFKGDLLVPSTPQPVTAEGLIEALSEEIAAINAGSGVVSSLDAKLSNALAALENIKRKDNASAMRMMFAFINAVEAQRGKELTDAQANQLITTAHEVIDLID
jgi:hypothetical protein